MTFSYIARRVLLMLATLIGVATLAFFLMHLSPGDPVDLFFGGTSEGSIDPETAANIKRVLGLDRPLQEQYFVYMASIFRLDLGTSFRSRRPVRSEIAAVMPYSVMLAVSGMLVAVLIGVPSGIASAIHRNRAIDYTVTVASTVGFAAPLFWVAMILIYVFSYKLRITPLFGVGDISNPASLAMHLVLPTVAVGLRHGAIIGRLTRSAMLRVLQHDCIRTARSKGISERKVIFKHAVKNVLVSIVTIVGYDFSIVIGSSMVTEVVFARPGLGRALMNSVFARDYAMVQGILLVIAFSIVVINLLVDLSYTLINPRIRYT